MRISGVTVCVGYAHLLSAALPRWLAGLDELTVVTTTTDQSTQDAVRAAFATHKAARAGSGARLLRVHETDAFYRGGASFNKGLALAEAFERPGLLGPGADAADAEADDRWFLTFDADVNPPDDWRTVVENATPTPGVLYGAYRFRALPSGARDMFRENELAGFFQLWHASDPNVVVRPLYDVHWRHAGGYDSEFQRRWPPQSRVKLPLTLEHVGEPGRNWWGVGNEAASIEMFRRRAELRGVDQARERMPGAPPWVR